ncbi:histidinol-phosphatase HisJ family protein [Siminovitchia sp. FSL W7-1587]|uniref:histidinol-phosphatase HisJ family protein n=1 Tax=Siminovitchia sp. FSL W7-1587 TaxID=2954699 RepID=UPI0030CBC80F
MMYLTDYHHHTDNSFDSQASMKSVCEEAIKKGINEICFTEHFSVNPQAITYGHMDFKRYFSQIEQCRHLFGQRLKIKVGLELCEPHLLQETYHEQLQGLPLDFILGSVHNIENQDIRSYMVHKEPESLYQRYFEEVYQLVSNADIDVVAHLDLMKRYAVDVDYLGTYDFHVCKEGLIEIFKKAIERNIGIEINTSGFAKKTLNEPLPSMKVLKLYKELGGEVLTIGSDSHAASTVGYHLDTALDMAKEAGFKYIYTFTSRQPETIKIV